MMPSCKLTARSNRTEDLLAAALPLAVFLLTLAVLGIRYEVNDDAILSNIASGAFGSGSQYLIYVNVLLGLFLRPFYQFFPTWNWYVILQLGLALVCFALLCRILLHRCGPTKGSLLAVGLLLTFGTDLFYSFQYVKNSGLFLVTGFVLLVLHLGSFCPALLGGIALIAVGSMLRFQNFFAVGALAAALLLWRFFQLDRAGKLRAVFTMCGLFLLVFGLQAIDHWICFAADGWAEFQRWNDVRTYISDFRLQYLQNPGLVALFGYDINDLWMIQRWNYYDPQVFPVETLEAFAALLPRNSFRNAAVESLKTYLRFVSAEPMFLCLGLAIPGWLVFADKKNWPAVLATGGMLGLLIFYLAFQGRQVHRVEWVLALAALLFVFCLCQPGKRTCSVPVLAGALAVLCLGTLGYWGTRWEQVQTYPEKHPETIALYDAMSADKEHLYLLDVDLTDSTAGYDLFHAKPRDYFSNMVFLGGWRSGCPADRDVLASYGFTENPYAALASGDDRVILADIYGAEIKQTYLQEHYGITQTLTPLYTDDTLLVTLYQLQ